MHVVHFITRLILGGAQENTVLTCEGQHAAGDRVALVTGPGLGPEGSLVGRARAGGYEVVELPGLVRNLRPLADRAAMRAFADYLEAEKPDLVHTHSGKAGVLGRAAAARVRVRGEPVPAIHTVHGPSFHRFQNPAVRAAFRAAERWAGPRTAKFISVADAMTDQYVAAGVAPREKFVTVRSGMHVEPFPRSPRPAGRGPGAVRLRGTRRGRREDRAAVGPQGPNLPDRRRRPAEGPLPAIEVPAGGRRPAAAGPGGPASPPRGWPTG